MGNDFDAMLKQLQLDMDKDEHNQKTTWALTQNAKSNILVAVAINNLAEAVKDKRRSRRKRKR